MHLLIKGRFTEKKKEFDRLGKIMSKCSKFSWSVINSSLDRLRGLLLVRFQITVLAAPVKAITKPIFKVKDTVNLAKIFRIINRAPRPRMVGWLVGWLVGLGRSNGSSSTKITPKMVEITD